MIRRYVVRYYSRSSYVNKGDSLLSLLTAVVLVFFLAMTMHLVDFGQRGKKVRMVTLKTYRLEMWPQLAFRPPRQSEKVIPRPVVQRPLAAHAQPKPRSTFRQPKQVVRSQAVAVQPKVVVSERSVSPPAVYRPSRSLASITGPSGPVEEVRREFPKRPPIDFGESARKIPDFTREIAMPPSSIGGGGGLGSPLGQPDISTSGAGIGRGPEGKGGYGTAGALGEGGYGSGGSGGGSGGGTGQGIGRGRGSSGPWPDPTGGGVPGPGTVSSRLLLRMDSPGSLADQLSNLTLISRHYGAKAVEVTFGGFWVVVKHRPNGSLEYIELLQLVGSGDMTNQQKEDLIRQGIRQIVTNWPQ